VDGAIPSLSDFNLGEESEQKCLSLAVESYLNCVDQIYCISTRLQTILLVTACNVLVSAVL